MRLIIIGCEFVGKTTLAGQISAWGLKNLGQQINWHDEWVVTDEGMGADTRVEFQRVPSSILESLRHYQISYHLNPGFFGDNDHCLVGFYFSEAVYAPLYHGYGGKGSHGDLEIMAAHPDRQLVATAPDVVLVTMTASPEVIRQRMAAPDAHETIQQSGDVEAIIKRFEELAARSFIRKRIALDTTDSTPEQTFAQFLTQMEPHFSQVDRMRLLVHRMGLAAPSSE